MRASSRHVLASVAGAVVTMAVTAAPAFASSITLDLGIDATTCTAASTTTGTTADSTVSLSTGSCSFLFGSGGTGTASAQGTFGSGGFSLGAMASLVGQASTFAEAMAYFSDTVVASGGTLGSGGYIQFVLTVDGSVTCPLCSDPTRDDRALALLGIAAGAPPTYPGSTRIGGTVLASGTTTTVLQLPIVFGSSQQFTIGLRTLADMDGTANTSVIADWFNTASLAYVVILDANGQVLPGGTLLSLGDTTYRTVSAVPEPASLILLASGVATAVVARRRRSSPRNRLGC